MIKFCPAVFLACGLSEWPSVYQHSYFTSVIIYARHAHVLFAIFVLVMHVFLYAILCDIMFMHVPWLCVTEKRVRAVLFERIKGCHQPKVFRSCAANIYRYPSRPDPHPVIIINLHSPSTPKNDIQEKRNMNKLIRNSETEVLSKKTQGTKSSSKPRPTW